MHEPTLHAQMEAANAYETFFVPALFQQWAPKVVDAAQIQPGQRVLDVACGTGILAREVVRRTGPTGSVVGLDPSPGMLAVAERLAPAVEWLQGAAESLPFPNQSFDAVVSQFGLMFFRDRRQALREMLRVLAMGGRMAVAVWDSLVNIPAYQSEMALLERIAGRGAADALRAPFVLGDRKDLATLFADAGVTAAEITTHHGTARFPSIRTMVEADLRGWLPVMGVILTEDQIDRILKEAEHALGSYVTKEGRVAFDSSAHLIKAVKPQQAARCAIEQAHIVGASSGGMIGQLAALRLPSRVLTLTLCISTPAVPKVAYAVKSSEHGSMGSDLPLPSASLLDKVRALANVDQSNRAAALAAFITEAHALAGIKAPTRVIHGTEDRVIPYPHGVALANEIPGARLLTLEGVGHELPRGCQPQVLPAIVIHTARGRFEPSV